jgi:predicted methyltransferase
MGAYLFRREQERSSVAQEVLGLLDKNVAANIGDSVGQRNALGADFDAVLREAALLNAAVAGQCAQALFLQDSPGGVVVEEFDLGDSGRAGEDSILLHSQQSSQQNEISSL